MRLYAHLVFAAFVLHARAATIPEKIVPELEKKLTDIAPEDAKVPTENVSSEQELIERVNIVKEIENNIGKSADIPVEVVVEDVQPSSKINEVADDDDIHRPAVDLRNPGPPQRQEHETQNPESYTDEQQTVTNVKNNLQETQVILRQGFQTVTDGIQNWITNNEQLNTIQQNIQTLSESFTAQIQKLNETLQGFVNPSNPVETVVEESQQKSNANFQKIETRLKILEDNFKNGVQTLSEGVQIVANLRAENENAASSLATTAPTAAASPSPAPPSNPFLQYLQQLQTTISHGFQNVTQAVAQAPGFSGIQNIFGQGSTPAGVQSDQPEGSTTQRPYPWQTWQSSINNFLNPQGQSGQTAPPTPSTPGPIAQAFQNLTAPFIQSVVNFIQPNRLTSTEKPAEAVTQASSNAIPASPVPPAVAQPASQPALQPEPQSAPQAVPVPEQPASQPTSGPIRQMLESNPVVQGIAGAVQRIQSSITNPEKPRDTDEKNDKLEKGGLIFLLKPGHGPGGGGSGDNSSIGAGLNEEKVQNEEAVPEVLKEEKDEKEMEKEQKPGAVADKTE